jgi:hypothetical protein
MISKRVNDSKHIADILAGHRSCKPIPDKLWQVWQFRRPGMTLPCLHEGRLTRPRPANFGLLLPLAGNGGGEEDRRLQKN